MGPITSTLLMGKLRHGEGKELALGHTGGREGAGIQTQAD